MYETTLSSAPDCSACSDSHTAILAEIRVPKDSGTGTERDAEGRGDNEVKERVGGANRVNHKERLGPSFLHRLPKTERHLQNG